MSSAGSTPLKPRSLRAAARMRMEARKDLSLSKSGPMAVWISMSSSAASSYPAMFSAFKSSFGSSSAKFEGNVFLQ